MPASSTLGDDWTMKYSRAVLTLVAAIFVSTGINRVSAQAPAPYEAILAQRNFMVPMRDGKKMATDIYLPGRNGVALNEKFPVLLQRTPYDKVASQKQAEYFTQHGYAVAVQDIRGRYKSEGNFAKVQPADATDGFDTIEWIAKQPWSNGSVGMWGTSFAAHMIAG